MEIPENKVCADCGAKNPSWASTNLGVFLCINCSGIHRSLGTSISKIKSIKLDRWSSRDIKLLSSIGNKKANEYWLARYKPAQFGNQEEYIRAKYVEQRWKSPESFEDFFGFSVGKKKPPVERAETHDDVPQFDLLSLS